MTFLVLGAGSAWALPTLVTNAATNVTDLKATLNATGNANGSNYSLRFDYGTSTNYGSTISSNPSNFFGTADTSLSATLANLLPNTTYHFRIDAGSGGVGNDMTFTTGPPASPPTITGLPNFALTTATVEWVQVASVFSGSSVTTISYEYGLSTSYGSVLTLSSQVDVASSTSSPLGILTGLTPNTTYHVRCKASNNEGTTYSPDATFTTLSVPLVDTQAASNVTDLGATLNGAINPHGTTVTAVVFQYGTSTSYGSSANSSPSLFTGSTTSSTSIALTSLQPSTTYHYRLRGNDSASVTWSGPDMTFTTAAAATPPKVTTGSATTVTATSAIVAATGTTGSSATTLNFDYGTTTAYGSVAVFTSSLPTNTSFTGKTVTLSGLTPSTTYHYRARAVNNEGAAPGSDATFTTLSVPVITTVAATGVTDLAATLKGTVNASGGSLSSVSFEYGATISYGTTVSATPSSVTGSSTTNVSAAPAGLLPNTTYHYRVRATDGGGNVYVGSDMTFTTLPANTPPSVVTGTTFSVTATTASIMATNIVSGSSPATLYFDYDTTTNYGSTAVSLPVFATNTTTSSRTFVITGLTPSTTYHFRARVVNNEGSGLGLDVVFMTLAAPVVTTGTTTGVTDLSATLNGTANAGGGSLSSSLFFDYGINAGYGSAVLATPGSATGSNTVSVSASLTKLTPATTYHYRLRGTDTAGLVYAGTDATFTTAPAATPPTVVTGAANPVGPVWAKLSATNLSTGSSQTVVFFDYGLTAAYGSQIYSATYVANVSSTSASVTLTGLAPGTTYHFRARAVNGEGTAVGADGTFTTITLPVVTTGAPSGVSDLAASLNGTVNAVGGPALSISFQYGTSSNYGSSLTASPASASGSSDVAESATLSGLAPNTTYHYRLQAADSVSTYFGPDMQFTTAAAATAPVATTGSATSITPISAALNASVTTGSSATVASFDYGLTTDYDSHVDGTSVLAANTTSSPSAGISGLNPGTLYHYRVRATNSQGTGTGADATFTTPPLPTVITGSPTAVSDINATFNGSATANSSTSYTASFDFGPTTDYGSSVAATPSSVTGSSATALSANPLGLLPATTYHYRLKLTFGSKSFLGSDATFTTNPAASPPTATIAAAQSISATTAYLRATNVNSGSSPATVTFLYGLTTAYGSTATFIPQPANHSYSAIGAAVTGLQPATTYHYAVTSTNAEGTFTSGDMTFSTGNAAVLTTGSPTGVADTAVLLNASVNPAGISSTLSFEYGLTTGYGSRTIGFTVTGTTLQGGSASLSGLASLTTYHYRARLDSVDGTFYGGDAVFTTSGFSAVPVLGQPDTYFVAASSATLRAGSVSAGNSDATVVFEYGTTTAYGSQAVAPATVPAFTSGQATAIVSGLQPNTLYYVRARATNNAGTGYSQVYSFMTIQDAVVTTGEASSVTDVSATLSGVANPGGSSLFNLLFEYGTTTAYGKLVSANPSSPSGYGNTPATVSFAGLLPNTLYHYRIRGQNSIDSVIYVGEDRTFTTGSPVSLPGVSTGTPTVKSTSATLSAGSISAGATSATLAWEYGLDSSYGSTVTYGTVFGAGATSTSASVSVTGLIPQTIYHCRAKITNDLGTTYGADTIFMTSAVAYSATTLPTAPLASTTATLNGSFVGNLGTNTLSFDYGPDTNYGTSIPGSILGTSSSFSATLSGLTPNTNYHYRAVNVTSAGTAYGTDMTFTTLADLAPVATTGTATGSTAGNATFRGFVNPRGVPTTVVFEYGTTTSYSLGSTTLPASFTGNGSASVSVSVSGLSSAVTYHYRLVATSSQGTTYGSDATVTMAAPPAVTTGSVLSVTQTTARIYLGSASGGQPITSYYEYGLTTDYGTVVPLTSPSAIASFGIDSPPLTPNTIYHYRLVASNSAGVSFGNDATANTGLAQPVTTLQPVSALSSTSATLNYTVAEYGATDSVFFEFGPDTRYGLTVAASPGLLSGVGVYPVALTVGGLAPGTTYHYHLRFSRATPVTGGLSYTTFVSTDQIFTTLTLAQNWRQQNFGTSANTGDAADGASPAGDGISNLMKYALGLDPHVSSTAVPQGVTKNYGGANYLGLTFARNPQNTDLTYEVQAADSPAGPWSPVADSVGGAVTTGPGFVNESPGANGMINVEVHDTVSSDAAPRRFLRLEVTR